MAPRQGGPTRPSAAEFPRYTPAERRADAAVHALGLTFALGACAALAVLAPPGSGATRLAGLGVYALGLLAMLGCSAGQTHEINPD